MIVIVLLAFAAAFLISAFVIGFVAQPEGGTVHQRVSAWTEIFDFKGNIQNAEKCSPHVWDYGVCLKCGEICTHPAHDKETHICPDCGSSVCHEYENLVCTVCGKQFEFELSSVDSNSIYGTGRQGSVETLTYLTKNYNTGSQEPIKKQMEVYLPYGYNEDEKYNVIFLIPGTDGKYTYWLTENHGYRFPDGDVDAVCLKTVLDNMIAGGLCKPVIVVSLTYYLNDFYRGKGDDYERDSLQLTYEFPQDILPAVISKYSTYAEGTDTAGISKVRNHFAVIGVSAGSVITAEAALKNNNDIFGYYGIISGCRTNADDILNSIASKGERIWYLVACAGENDSNREKTKELFDGLSGNGIVDNSNSAYLEIEGAGHEDRVWFTGIYNCLQIFFTN